MKVKIWECPYDLAKQITEIDQSEKQIRINQASSIARQTLKLYKEGGKEMVDKFIQFSMLDNNRKVKQRLTPEQIESATNIVHGMFAHYWNPFSNIRSNVKRLCK